MKPILNKYYFLLRRELWEYKNSVLWTPIAIAIALILLIVIGMMVGSIGLHGADIKNFMDAIAQENDPNFNLGIDTTTPEFFHAAISFGTFMIMIIIAGIVSLVYFLGTLHQDRKDRSILFWKSLPISETENVLLKLVFGSLAIQLIAVMVSIPVRLVMSIVASYLYSHSGSVDYSFWSALSDMDLISDTLYLVAIVIISAVVYLPLTTWLMFSSAVTKRAPILVAIFVPFIVVVGENIIFRTSYIGDFLESLAPNYYSSENFQNSGLLFTFQGLSNLISNTMSVPQLIRIVLVSAALLWATIWLRNNRYEI